MFSHLLKVSALYFMLTSVSCAPDSPTDESELKSMGGGQCFTARDVGFKSLNAQDLCDALLADRNACTADISDSAGPRALRSCFNALAYVCSESDISLILSRFRTADACVSVLARGSGGCSDVRSAYQSGNISDAVACQELRSQAFTASSVACRFGLIKSYYEFADLF